MTDNPQSELASELDALALAMVKEAKSASTPLNVRVDVFKAVSQHYVSTSKVKPKGLPPIGAAATMDGLRNRVSAATGEGESTGRDEEEDDE